MTRRRDVLSRRGFVQAAVGGMALTLARGATARSNASIGAAQSGGKSFWPPITSQCRPWCYNWWMGSAVNAADMSRELARYKAAGLGGVHIIPIYGARGWEKEYLPYLNKQWMDMLHYDLAEAHRLGMGVDMTTGTGWNFGGPDIAGDNASLYARPIVLTAPRSPEARWVARLPRGRVVYARAFADDGRQVEVPAHLVRPHGTIAWQRPAGKWKLVVLVGHPGSKVKRAAPGGHGMMLNTIYAPAMAHYLKKFTQAFAAPGVKMPRAMYHDSYEYFSGVPRGYGEWSADLFEQFARLRGYRLEEHLPALAGDADKVMVGRVQADYRRTVSDLIVDSVFSQWAAWCRQRGMLTRNQAHGSPTNLLDFYNVADIPEPEGNFGNRSRIGQCHPLIAKFASSPAHIVGKRLVSSETGTWLAEHFKVTLADLKQLVDQFFLGGVNHLFYHGTCYSPDDAAWPGWLFYAATDMNPRMSIWRDARTLNNYVARCQSLLQAGRPDNDVLLYWPIHDQWHRPGDMAQYQTMTNQREWFYGQPIGTTARRLWDAGIGFDYLSDRLLKMVRAAGGRLQTPGASYAAIVVPPVTVMPPATLRRLIQLATKGATIIFAKAMPSEPPGMGRRAKNEADLRHLKAGLTFQTWKKGGAGISQATVGTGLLFTGSPVKVLSALGIDGETLVKQPGLLFLRRKVDGDTCYLLVYQGKKSLDCPIRLAVPARDVVLMDPMTGNAAPVKVKLDRAGRPTLRIVMEPNQSVILRALPEAFSGGAMHRYVVPGRRVARLVGPWDVAFVSGGPTLPRDYQAKGLGSWTDNGDVETQSFSGTARYTIRFDAPSGKGPWLLDLGRVCQSSRVRVNGRDLGGLILPPYRLVISDLKVKANLLEVEVTNLPANRIRFMDRKGERWRIFHDINFCDISYHHFNAAQWPVEDSGLMGPVTLMELA